MDMTFLMTNLGFSDPGTYFNKQQGACDYYKGDEEIMLLCLHGLPSIGVAHHYSSDLTIAKVYQVCNIKI